MKIKSKTQIIQEKKEFVEAVRLFQPGKAEYMSFLLELYKKDKISLNDLERMFVELMSFPGDIIFNGYFAFGYF
ncbi:MAG: hypothetical protein QXP36_03310 [Conexivisphaerales archaeon]